jgi:hypothetical protein
MISVYFLSTEKKQQVDALVAAGLAVKQEMIPDSVSEMSLRPTEQLLALCPLQAVKGALGCITRYEIKSRSLDIRTNSIVDIAPESPDDYATVIENAGLWTQYSLGDTVFANTLGERHADVMNQEFALNRRYRKGFMVSPVIPWRASDIRAEGFASSINLAQFSLSFVLLAFDQNVGISYEPTVQVSIPGSLPIPPEEFTQNLELQSALASAYAQGLGLPDSSVSIDPDSITSETVNTTADDARRRLLELKTITKYECVVKFYETETTASGESVAAQKAAEIVDVLTEAESPVADIVFEKVTKSACLLVGFCGRNPLFLCLCCPYHTPGGTRRTQSTPCVQRVFSRVSARSRPQRQRLRYLNGNRSKKPWRKSAPTASSRPRPTSSRRSSCAPSSRPRCARTTAAWTPRSAWTSRASAAAPRPARRASSTAWNTPSARAARSTTNNGRPSAAATTS